MPVFLPLDQNAAVFANGFMSQSMDLPPKQGEIITASVRLAVLNLCFVLVSGVPGLAVGTELRLELLFG